MVYNFATCSANFSFLSVGLQLFLSFAGKGAKKKERALVQFYRSRISQCGPSATVQDLSRGVCKLFFLIQIQLLERTGCGANYLIRMVECVSRGLSPEYSRAGAPHPQNQRRRRQKGSPRLASPGTVRAGPPPLTGTAVVRRGRTGGG